MSLWNYLKLPEDEQYTLWKQARQEQASMKVDEFGDEIMAECQRTMDWNHKHPELARQISRSAKE